MAQAHSSEPQSIEQQVLEHQEVLPSQVTCPCS